MAKNGSIDTVIFGGQGEWCPTVGVPKVEVVDTCELPGLPDIEWYDGPDAEPPFDLQITPRCQPINIHPIVKTGILPSCYCKIEDLSEIKIPEILKKYPKIRQKVYTRFRLDDNKDDACEGKYAFEIFQMMDCVLKKIPPVVEGKTQWTEKIEVETVDAECDGCIIKFPPKQDKKPKIVLQFKKSEEECQIDDVKLDMTIPCVLESIKDTKAKIALVEIKKKISKGEKHDLKINSLTLKEPKEEECAIDEIEMELDVPAGCANTSVKPIVLYKYKKYNKKTANEYSGSKKVEGEKAEPNTDTCDIDMNTEMEIPVLDVGEMCSSTTVKPVVNLNYVKYGKDGFGKDGKFKISGDKQGTKNDTCDIDVDIPEISIPVFDPKGLGCVVFSEESSDEIDIDSDYNKAKLVFKKKKGKKNDDDEPCEYDPDVLIHLKRCPPPAVYGKVVFLDKDSTDPSEVSGEFKELQGSVCGISDLDLNIKINKKDVGVDAECAFDVYSKRDSREITETEVSFPTPDGPIFLVASGGSVYGTEVDVDTPIGQAAIGIEVKMVEDSETGCRKYRFVPRLGGDSERHCVITDIRLNTEKGVIEFARECLYFADGLLTVSGLNMEDRELEGSSIEMAKVAKCSNSDDPEGGGEETEPVTGSTGA